MTRKTQGVFQPPTVIYTDQQGKTVVKRLVPGKFSFDKGEQLALDAAITEIARLRAENDDLRKNVKRKSRRGTEWAQMIDLLNAALDAMTAERDAALAQTEAAITAAVSLADGKDEADYIDKQIRAMIEREDKG